MSHLRDWTLVTVCTLACFTCMLIPQAAEARPPRKSRRAKTPLPPTTGTLQVYSITQGGHVEVDGRPVGTLPLKSPVSLLPGSHSVRVWKRGHLEYLGNVEIFAGEVAEVDADLLAIAGMVKITGTVPGSQVFIDGKLAGDIPFDKDVPAGKHKLSVRAKGHSPYEDDVEIVAGEWLKLHAVLHPMQQITAGDGASVVGKWWFWTVIGTLVVGGAATGLALGLQDKSGGAQPTPARVLNLQ